MNLLIWIVSLALAAARPPSVSVGQPALLFVLPAINEDVALSIVNRPTVALADFSGTAPQRPAKAIVLHFFDQDRGGDALDALNHIQRRYGNKGVQVLAISRDSGDLGALSTWLEGQKLTFPVLRDNHGIVAGRYGVDDLPLTIVIDGNGNVFAIGQPMGDEVESTIMAEVAPLIGK